MEITAELRNYKDSFDSELYMQMADFCNSTQKYLLEDKGDYYEVVAIPEPSESELRRRELESELYTLKSWLSEHDYIGTKIATGRATVAEYADIIEEMKAKANRINEIDSILGLDTQA